MLWLVFKGANPPVVQQSVKTGNVT